MKTCRLCKIKKPNSAYRKDASRPSGFRNECTDCLKKRQRDRVDAEPNYYRNTRSKSLYGNTWDELVQEFGGLCAICGTTENLHVDHCHRFGYVRGILCSSCNHGLGNYKDNPELLRKAAEYLEDI